MKLFSKSALLAATAIMAPAAATDYDAVQDRITVTARRVSEDVQTAPIPISVVSGDRVSDSGAFNTNRLKELVPTLQFYTSNPRNSAINIRGLGAPYGLANDGIEPGVGLYVDGVFYARPAAATLDFIDVRQIEVLRGPQGTLYGKNTTAGAINVTTRKPTFTPEGTAELSYGNYGFLQAKASISGPLSDTVAARLSFSGTQRDGFLYNVASQDDLNDLSNLGFRGRVLYQPTDKFSVTFAGDLTRQRPEGYAQVIAGVAPTLRAPNRQWAAIAADLGYAPPSYNAFDRLTDTDSPWRSYQEFGGASVTFDWNVGPGALTAITAWRFWDWSPSNDRDFTGLDITTVSAAPSTQRQWTQELRYAGDLSSSLSFVVGAFGFRQTLNADPSHVQEQGGFAAQRYLLNPSTPGWDTPGLLDGYGQNVTIDYANLSAAVFGQLQWTVTDRLRLLPGVRFNYDEKDAFYDSQVYGGLDTADPALIALKRSVLSPQTYAAQVDDANVSWQATAAYAVSDAVNFYATYATSFKSVGLNLSGAPNNASGQPALDAATVKPEDVRHIEVGFKTTPFSGAVANVSFFDTVIDDFQTQVVNAQVGVLRGYLANAEKARVRGVEFDGSARLSDSLSVYGAAAWTDAKYISFPDAPPPLELTGGPAVFDASGTRLPGVSKWAASAGGEYAQPGSLFGLDGDFFIGVDASYRSSFSSSPSQSAWLNVDAYTLVNARAGFRTGDRWDVFLWTRNLFDKNYYELMSAAPGNSGLYVGLPGDPRSWGATMRARF